MLDFGDADRRQLRFEEVVELVSSGVSLEGFNNEKIEGEVSGTEDGIRQGPYGDFMGSTHGAAC